MSRKIRICFFNTTRFWGGGEKWHLEAAKFMANRGHQVLAVVHPGGELSRRIANLMEVATVPLSVSNLSFINPAKILKLINVFRTARIEVVVFNGSSDVKIGAISARMAGVPAIVYRRGLALPVRNSFFNRFLYGRLITHILTNSRETANVFLKRLKLPDNPDKIRIIYNGIDLQRFKLSNVDNDRKRESSPIIIGTAGRLDAQKGHDSLLEVTNRLKKSGLNFRLLVAGEGNLHQHLEKQIQRLGLKGTARLLGFVSDMEKFMQDIDIFAFPSLWEGFGYAAAEAMAAQRPVVAFDVSSNREVIEDKVTGFLVPEKSLDLFGEKILQLAKTPELRTAMGQAGRARVQERFERTRQLNKLETYLCQTISGE